MERTSVIAEDAPIGVPLWPTTHPRFDRNFTLSSVSTVRDSYGTHVLWLYENGETRSFSIGERVSVEYPAATARFTVGQRVVFRAEIAVGSDSKPGVIDMVLGPIEVSVENGCYLMTFDGGGQTAVFSSELEAQTSP